ncbi:MAG: DUF2459 domain-containing protein [Planktomarina sp.]
MRRFFRWFCLICLIPIVYLVAAGVGAFVPSGVNKDGQAETSILLISGPIHYDILILINDEIRRDFSFLIDAGIPIDHPGAEWLVVGWGAKTFYTQTQSYQNTSARAVWRGIFGDDAVLRMDVFGAFEPTHGQYLTLNDQQFNELTGNILNSFASRQAMGTPGFTATDAFYPAQGRFHIFRTCNVWVGEQLRAAHLRFGAWTPTPFSVRWALWWHQDVV